MELIPTKIHAPHSDSPLTVGRSPRASFSINHPSVSREHAKLELRGETIWVIDLGSRAKTFVNGHPIQESPLQDGDKVEFAAIAYRLQGNELHLTRDGLELHARHLQIRSDDGKLLVADVSFGIQPDRFIGIVGPSGSGKSTLLDGLVGQPLPGPGHLLFDGLHDVADEQGRYLSMVAYVPQADILYKRLTVRETLRDAACLRFGEPESEAVQGSINRVIEDLDLTSAADEAALCGEAPCIGIGRFCVFAQNVHNRFRSLIGIHGREDVKVKQIKELSGGEQRRVSVAIELLKRPGLLLLDEPTTGLDPANAEKLMGLLQALAKRGTTVVCTTHALEHFDRFDEILVMSKVDEVGRLAYSGTPQQVLKEFGANDFAELFRQLKNGGRTPRLENAKNLASQGCGRDYPAGKAPAVQAGSSFLGQLKMTSFRTARLICRDRGLFAMLLLQPFLLGGLVCLTQFHPSTARPVLFLAVVLAIWLGLNNSVRVLVCQRKQYVRDRMAGLRPGAYLLSNWLVYGFVGALQVAFLILVLAVGRYLAMEPDVRGTNDLASLPLNSWCGLALVLLLSYFGGLGLGLLVSAWVSTEESAVAWLPVIIMPQLLLSAMATGTINDRLFELFPGSIHDFRWTAPSGGWWSRHVVDMLSLFCFSRPAAAILFGELPDAGKDAAEIRLKEDGRHLLVLVVVTAAVACWIFFWQQRRWRIKDN